MKIFGHKYKVKQLFCLFLYYTFAYYLPDSYSRFGYFPNKIRCFLVSHIFKKCGKIRTINRRVDFGSGFNVEMGDDSGIGCNVHLPSDTIIGKNVMVGRYTFILRQNHAFDRLDIAINDQGDLPPKQTILEDNVWIGLGCYFTPGRHVMSGTVTGMGTVLTKDFPENSVIGGNPGKLIRIRG